MRLPRRTVRRHAWCRPWISSRHRGLVGHRGDRTELARGETRDARDERAVAVDDLTAGHREAGASAAAAALARRDQRLSELLIHGRHEQPGLAVRYAHVAR